MYINTHTHTHIYIYIYICIIIIISVLNMREDDYIIFMVLVIPPSIVNTDSVSFSLSALLSYSFALILYLPYSLTFFPPPHTHTHKAMRFNKVTNVKHKM